KPRQSTRPTATRTIQSSTASKESCLLYGRKSKESVTLQTRDLPISLPTLLVRKFVKLAKYRWPSARCTDHLPRCICVWPICLEISVFELHASPVRSLGDEAKLH